mmetsp:Transcript_9537/g.27005  ORF Transcript_9537/g.27005 Transcript_9537/m.27005 type:complete len:296 (+) Transcript_9537:92-979(+)
MDDLFSLRNLYWIGNYEAAIDEAQTVKPKTDRETIDRDVFLYRSLIGQGKGAEVIEKVGAAGSTSTDVQVVNLLATFVTQPAQREAVQETLAEWLTDENIKDNKVLQLIAATVFFRAGDTKEALKALRAPSDLEQAALRVQILLSMNRVDLAEQELSKMQGEDDDATLTQLATGWVLLANGGKKCKEAALIFQELMSKSVQSTMLLNAVAMSHMQMKQFNEAEKYLVEAQEKNDSDVDVLVNLVSCYCNLRKPEANIQATLDKLRQVAPDHALLAQLSACEATFDQVAAAQSASA